MTTRTLPRWHASMSDGCSVPKGLPVWLRALVTIPVGCCQAHDAAYYYGGSEADRARVDRAFMDCLIDFGMPAWKASAIYRLVRLFGGPSARTPGVSWAFGGSYFQYDDQPAVPNA